MTPTNWNVDDARLDEVDDEFEEIASAWRYGVTGWETAHPEPFAVALAQEQPDVRAPVVDEQWAEVDEVDEPAGRLIADVSVGDDDYALTVDDDIQDFAPEELAMHLVTP
jgi:hypothetical protein